MRATILEMHREAEARMAGARTFAAKAYWKGRLEVCRELLALK